jgi:hypothetical protein
VKPINIGLKIDQHCPEQLTSNEIRFNPDSLASAIDKEVFPVPGGPDNKMPLGELILSTL